MDNNRISKQYKFSNFAKSMAFVIKVGDIAEEEGHHPDIKFGWGYAEMELSTHAVGGLTKNDFIMAAKIDAIM